MTSAKFNLGRVVATPGALEAIASAGQTPLLFLKRHHACDWGEVDSEDWETNEESLTSGARILSAYQTALGVRLWIITEAADEFGRRPATTLLLPEEY